MKNRIFSGLVLGGLAFLAVIGAGVTQVWAQATVTSWEPPAVANSGSCQQVAAMNYAAATTEQMNKFTNARCVKLSAILANSPTTPVCGHAVQPSFIGQAVFAGLPKLNFATVSAAVADTFKYEADLCPTGSICTFCTVEPGVTTGTGVGATPTPTGTTTPRPTPSPNPTSATGAAQTATGSASIPVTGSGEILLFTLLGVGIVGSGVYIFTRTS